MTKPTKRGRTGIKRWVAVFQCSNYPVHYYFYDTKRRAQECCRGYRDDQRTATVLGKVSITIPVQVVGGRR
jgi:hypothetical protein